MKTFTEHLQDVLKKTLDEDLWSTFESFLEHEAANKEGTLNLANQLLHMQEVRNLGDIGHTLSGIDQTLQNKMS